MPAKEKTATTRQEKKKASKQQNAAVEPEASPPPKESTMTLKSLLGVSMNSTKQADQSTSSSVSSKSSGPEKSYKSTDSASPKQPDALAQLFATGVKSSSTPKTAHRASLVEELLKSGGSGVSPRRDTLMCNLPKLLTCACVLPGRGEHRQG